MDTDVKKDKNKRSDIPESKPRSKSHWEGEIINTLQDIETDYRQFKDNIKNLKDNLSGFIDETESKIESIDRETQKKVEKEIVDKKMENVKDDINEVDQKIFDVMEEMGFGESLDVSQIPPNILEEVYEDTLEDVVKNMRNNLGDRETQEVVQTTLENMRTRTSGSELFQYDGRTINVRNFVKSIEQNLISAKQIHSTYTELLNKLEENLPGYESKNFRSMMKSKSLEFAIGKTTDLIRRTGKLEDKLNNTSNILSTFTNQMNQQMNGLRTDLSSIKEEIDNKIDERFTQFDERLDDLEGSVEDLSEINEKVEELDHFKEDKEELEEKIDEIEASYEMEISRLEDKIESLKEPEKTDEGTSDIDHDLTDEESFVYYAIPDDGGTLNKIEKSVGEVVSDAEEKLESLIEKDAIKKFKRGRWTIYQRVEEEEEEEEYEGVENGVEGEEEIDYEDTEEDQEEELEEETGAEGESETSFLSSFEQSSTDEDVIDGGDEEDESEDILEGLEEEEKMVWENIEDEGCTLSKLNRNIEELESDKIEEILEGLIDRDKISTEKRNRWKIYLKATNPKEVK